VIAWVVARDGTPGDLEIRTSPRSLATERIYRTLGFVSCHERFDVLPGPAVLFGRGGTSPFGGRLDRPEMPPLASARDAMADEEHLVILKRGVETWNAWRRACPEVVPDASGVDLSGVDLSGANLNRADLGGADLSGADLSGANLGGANLSGADLSGANLSGANLNRADLLGVDLSRTNLSEAHLSGAHLSENAMRGWGSNAEAILPDGSDGSGPNDDETPALTLFFDLQTMDADAVANVINILGAACGGHLDVVRVLTLPQGTDDAARLPAGFSLVRAQHESPPSVVEDGADTSQVDVVARNAPAQPRRWERFKTWLCSVFDASRFPGVQVQASMGEALDAGHAVLRKPTLQNANMEADVLQKRAETMRAGLQHHLGVAVFDTEVDQASPEAEKLRAVADQAKAAAGNARAEAERLWAEADENGLETARPPVPGQDLLDLLQAHGIVGSTVQTPAGKTGLCFARPSLKQRTRTPQL
jgi:uncharacterized protein YjbI with pentapeptide repeats